LIGMKTLDHSPEKLKNTGFNAKWLTDY